MVGRRVRISRARMAALPALVTLVMITAATTGGGVSIFSTQAAPLGMPAFADPAMQTVWARNDLPVEQGQASRSWTWGPAAVFAGHEPYAQGPNGQHLVQYFD